MVRGWWHQHLHNLHPTPSWGEKGREWGEEELSLQLPYKINANCTLLVIHSIPALFGIDTAETNVRIQPWRSFVSQTEDAASSRDGEQGAAGVYSDGQFLRFGCPRMATSRVDLPRKMDTVWLMILLP